MSINLKKQKWELEFWKNENDNIPVLKILEKTRKKDPVFVANIFKKIDQFKDKKIDDLKKTQDIKDYDKDISALRIFVNKKKFRFLGTILYDKITPVFKSFHAFQKNEKVKTKKELPIAQKRFKKFKENKK